MEFKVNYQEAFNTLINVEPNHVEVCEHQEPLFVLANKIPVYRNSELSSKLGAIIACITISTESYRPFILVDNLFDKLSMKAKVFVIYHELGHYQNGDFLVKNKKSKKDIIKENLSRKYPEREVLADYYATDQMNSLNDVLESLDEIAELILKHTNPVNAKLKDIKKYQKNLKRRFALRKDSLIKMVQEGPYFIDEESNDYDKLLKEKLGSNLSQQLDMFDKMEIVEFNKGVRCNGSKSNKQLSRI